jgi:hypothetical protein
MVIMDDLEKRIAALEEEQKSHRRLINAAKLDISILIEQTDALIKNDKFHKDQFLKLLDVLAKR